MCRAVVRGKIQCIEEEDSAEKRAEKGIDFSDAGDKLRKGNNGNDGGTARKVGQRPSPEPVLSTGGAVSSNAPGHKPYTPLQRWEYENGLPVDGVDDVKRWAVQVGLADYGDVDMPRNKKFKGHNNTEPPKYGTSTIRLTISSPELHQSHLENTSGSDTDIEAESKAKDKGKEKM